MSETSLITHRLIKHRFRSETSLNTIRHLNLSNPSLSFIVHSVFFKNKIILFFFQTILYIMSSEQRIYLTKICKDCSKTIKIINNEDYKTRCLDCYIKYNNKKINKHCGLCEKDFKTIYEWANICPKCYYK